jgi:SAM-dependent methyltransferase
VTIYDRSFFDGLATGSDSSAAVIVPLAVAELAPNSVLDVGCGEGLWLSYFIRHEVRDVLGLDGPYVERARLLIPSENFQAVDLERFVPPARRFDLAVCLEVVEHLSPAAGERLVDGLVQCSDRVLFSAAVPGQGGSSHRNEQWLSYWVQRFQRWHYSMVDLYRPRIAYDQRVSWWYRQNLVLFASESGQRALSVTGHVQSVSDPQEWVHVETVRRLLGWRTAFSYLLRRSLSSLRLKLDRRARHV